MMRFAAFTRSPPTGLARLAVAAACALAFSFNAVASGQAPEQPVAQGPATVQDDSQALRRARMADLGGESVSPEARHVAHWAVHSGDHRGQAFVVVDKVDGRLYVFDAAGRLRGASTALVGAARGDHSVPGIGDRPISKIRPDERTTPAGRFAARMGHGPKGEDVLWVDYEGAVAIHRVVTGQPKERRLERLASKVALDRRITYGCINLPVNFFESVVLPLFKQDGGVVYVLPELRHPQDLFGSYEVGEDAGASGAPALLPVSR